LLIAQMFSGRHFLIPAARDGRYIPHGRELPVPVEGGVDGGSVTTLTAGGSVTTRADEATGVGADADAACAAAATCWA